MDDKELVDVWRKEFESQFGDDLFARGTSGAYINNHRNSMWQGFCMAKRSQPSVVLPKPSSYAYGIGIYIEQEVNASLTAAGIKYTIGE